MHRVKISKGLLLWAIARAGLTLEQLTSIKGYSDVADWIAEKKQPTLRQIQKFAKKVHVPLGYLFLKEPPTEELPVPFYRTLKDESVTRYSVELIDTIYDMERRQDWLREFLKEEGRDPLPFVGSLSQDIEAAHAAERIRSALSLGQNWAVELDDWKTALRALRGAMQNAGILVFINGVVGLNNSRKLNVKEFRGFVMVDEYAPLVFVNARDARAAQMFTLAHELAHIFLGKGAAFDLRNMQAADNPTENACNLFAAEFLVPEVEIRKQWTSTDKYADQYMRFSRQFKVSPLCIAKRAMDLDLTPREDFFEFYNSYIAQAAVIEAEQQEKLKARKKEGKGSIPFWQVQGYHDDRNFAVAVIRATQEGKLLYKEAYALTGYRGSTFDEYSQRVMAS